MTDYRKGKDRGEPAVEFQWDSLTLASDKTFSTTIRIQVSGWWAEGRPKEVALSVYEREQEPPAGDAVRIQKGYGTFPLTGLKPGHHYHAVVYIEDRTPVQKIIIVPELPKPKKPEEKEFEREQIAFKRTELTRKLEGLKPDQEEQALESDRIRLERAKVARELREIEKKNVPCPTDFVVDEVGGNGKYKLFVSVFSKEKPESPGVGIPDVVVVVFDRSSGESWEGKSSLGGVATFELSEFIERDKIVAVRVQGLPVVKDHQLLGPRIPVRL